MPCCLGRRGTAGQSQAGLRNELGRAAGPGHSLIGFEVPVVETWNNERPAATPLMLFRCAVEPVFLQPSDSSGREGCTSVFALTGALGHRVVQWKSCQRSSRGPQERPLVPWPAGRCFAVRCVTSSRPKQHVPRQVPGSVTCDRHPSCC